VLRAWRVARVTASRSQARPGTARSTACVAASLGRDPCLGGRGVERLEPGVRIVDGRLHAGVAEKATGAS